MERLVGKLIKKIKKNISRTVDRYEFINFMCFLIADQNAFL